MLPQVKYRRPKKNKTASRGSLRLLQGSKPTPRPCGGCDATPTSVVGRAAELGLDIIAVID
jgi:hypothetical protein